MKKLMSRDDGMVKQELLRTVEDDALLDAAHGGAECVHLYRIAPRDPITDQYRLQNYQEMVSF